MARSWAVPTQLRHVFTAMLASSLDHLHVQWPQQRHDTWYSCSEHTRWGHCASHTLEGRFPRSQNPPEPSSYSNSLPKQRELVIWMASEGVCTTTRRCSTRRRPKRYKKWATIPGGPCPSFGLHSTSTANLASASREQKGMQLSQSCSPPGKVLWLQYHHGATLRICWKEYKQTQKCKVCWGWDMYIYI